MKVLHVPYSFFPDPVGGTEVYVSGLIEGLRKDGVDNAVAAPGDADRSYVHDGTPVHRFEPGSLQERSRDLYALEDSEGAERFAKILDAAKPEVVHLHALTRTVGINLLETVKERGVPVVFSYHSPTVTCQRGTLIRWGQTICDGKIRIHTCSACTLEGAGVPMPLAVGLGSSPKPLSKLSLLLLGRAGTGAGMTYLMRMRRDATTSFLEGVDRIIVMASWTLGVLEQNGIAPEKVVLSPHGINPPPEAARSKGSGNLRLAWLGRVGPEKGLSAILEIFAGMPNAPIELDVFPLTQNPGDRALLDSARSASGHDRRIRFRDPVESGAVVQTLRGSDGLVLTPRWLETGPLVLLEAQAAGIPVIGPRLGGIAEKVREGVDGFLVDPFSSEEFRSLVAELAANPGKLRDLRDKAARPRSMAEVASETIAVYESVLT